MEGSNGGQIYLARITAEGRPGLHAWAQNLRTRAEAFWQEFIRCYE